MEDGYIQSKLLLPRILYIQETVVFNLGSKEVFVWAENLRLKLEGGESAGAVKAVVSHPSENNAVIVSPFFLWVVKSFTPV